MQTRFILVRPRPVPVSSPQATHLRFSTFFVKILFTTSEHLRDPFPLCLGNTIQETTSLMITIDFLRKTERFLSFRVDNTI